MNDLPSIIKVLDLEITVDGKHITACMYVIYILSIPLLVPIKTTLISANTCHCHDH